MKLNNLLLHLIFLMTLGLVSCAKNQPKDLFVFTAPNKAFVAFNSSGSIPKDIPNGVYKGYMDGTAINNCLVNINGKDIKNSGELDIKIEKDEPFKELKIDCSKGNGKKGKTYSIRFNLTINNTIYKTDKIEIKK